MSTLQGPNALSQPIHEFHIISHAPKQGLTQVYMALDKAGDHQLTPGINDEISGLAAVLIHLNNPVILNKYIQDLYIPVFIHGDHQAIGNQ